MGCVNSQQSQVSFEPLPQPTPSSNVVEDSVDQDAENGSDFYIPLEDARSDEVELEDLSQIYPQIKPRTKHDRQTTGMSIPFYRNWKLQLEDVLTEEKYDPTKRIYPTIGDIDQRARQAPSSYGNNFDELIRYLTKDVEKGDDPEILRVRALLVWLCNQKVSRSDEEQSGLDSPKGLLNLLAQRKTTYASVFAVLCRKAKIPCVRIQGISKGRSYKPGNTTLGGMSSSWNAVFINGAWHIIHPFWVSQTLRGHGLHRWVRNIPFDSKESNQSTDINDRVFEEYFFMCSPKEFVYMCLPDEEKWQLLPRPLSEDTFMEQTYLFPPFFGLGFRMKSQRKCVLKAADGLVEIALETKAKNSNTLDLYFELQTIGSSKYHDHEFLQTDKIQRLVRMIRCGSKWKFHINLPQPGAYIFLIFGGPHKQAFLRLAEFRLECESNTTSCVLLPIDTGVIGFGPGPTLENAGLHFPSHRNGIYAVKVNEPITMTFHMYQEELNILIVTSELCIIDSEVSAKTDVSLKDDAVAVTLLKKRLQCQVTVKVPHSGEFLLSICIYREGESPPRKTKVCHYILSTLVPQKTENTHLKLARARLKEIMEKDLTMDVEDNRFQERIDEIKEAVDRCLKQKISPEDEEIEASEIRIQYLMARKEIHDAHLRSHLSVTMKTLKFLRHSRFVYSLQKSIAHLEERRKDQEEEWKERFIKGYRQKKFENIVNVVMANRKNIN